MIIPKGGGKFRGTGIVEVLWKAFWGVVNQRIGEAVQFHDVLHGFWVGQWTGITSLEAKLIQQ